MPKLSTYDPKTTLVAGDKIAIVDSADSDKVKLVEAKNAQKFMQKRVPDPAPAASSGTVDLSGTDYNEGEISGSTTITAIVLEEGKQFVATCTGSPLFTYHATNLPINGKASLQGKPGMKIKLVGGAGDVGYIESFIPEAQQNIERVTEVSVGGGGTVTPNMDTTDVLVITATGAFTLAAPTGTPRQKQSLQVHIVGTAGPSYIITYNAIYREIGCRKIDTASGVGISLSEMSYNQADNKWDIEYTALNGTSYQGLIDALYITVTNDISAAVVGLLEDKGNQDCSANPNYPAALKGDVYTVSVAGKIGGASGVTVEVGDWFRAIADNAGGTQAGVGTSWVIVQANLVGAVVSGGALGTPSSGALTNCTGLPVAGGGTGASTAGGARDNLDVPADTWTVVSSASASVSPTAADSGTYYRLSHANPTFNLPTTSLVVGKTHFWLTFAGSDGSVDAGSGKTVDNLGLDGSGSSGQTVSGCCLFHLYHFKYVATNTWASNLLHT